jgi:hypothetical protein
LVEEFCGNNTESKGKVRAVCAGNFRSYPEQSIKNEDSETEGLTLRSWGGHWQSVEELQCLHLQGQSDQEE